MGKVPREVSKRLVKSSLKSSNRISKSSLGRKPSSISQEKTNYKSSESVSSFVQSSSDISSAVDLLEKLNFRYEMFPDAQLKQNFFIQDKFMNAFYTYYPEYICCDVLSEIPALDYKLVLFIGLDTNGHCEILSIGLIKSGNLQGFAWLCEMFKRYNPLWNKIEFITCNQNLKMREMLKLAFHEKVIFISFFHSMKAFKKDLTDLQPVVSNQDISRALQVFEQMFFAISESAYMELLKQMKQMSPNIFGLFKKNWHPIKELWALGINFDSKIFLKTFNSFFLSLRKQLKPLISSQESVEGVIQRLNISIIKLRKEWFQKFTTMFYSSLSINQSNIRVVQKYSKYLTPYAAELINEQLNISTNMRYIQKIDNFSYKINGCETVSSYNTCCCNFHKLMMLPCCHIFAIRNYLSLPLYDLSTRSSWDSKKYQTTFLNLYLLFISDTVGCDAEEQSNRFKKCIDVSREMWDLLLDCNEMISQERLEIFQSILKAWKNNFKIGVQVSEKQNDSSSANNDVLENLPTDHFKEMYGISLNDILDSENEFCSLSLGDEESSDIL